MRYSVTPRARKLTFLAVLLLLTILAGKLMWAYRVIDAPFAIYGITVTTVLFLTFAITAFRYRDPYMERMGIGVSDERRESRFPLVSCMVAVRDEEKMIEQCVDSMKDQVYRNIEIIVVDDASTDSTREILDRYEDDPKVKVIHLEKNVGKKAALAQAMESANGAIFAFTDSDSVMAKDAIEKLVKVMVSDPDVGAIAGHCRALNADKNIITAVQDSWYEGQFSVRKAFESIWGVVTCVSGPLAVFRREAIYNYIPAWVNDQFLGQEFRFATDRTLTGFVLGGEQKGPALKEKFSDSPFVTEADYPCRSWKIEYCKSARAYTNVPETPQQVIKQQVRWKKSFIRNTFFTGSFYWRKPLLPAIFYYLHILFVVVGPFMVFRHVIYLPLNGNFSSAVLYLAGIAFIGLMFGIAYKAENQDCHRWVYRPIMSLMSTLVFSWLIFYSILTIRKSIWARA